MAMPWSDEEYQRERERLAALSQAPPISPFDPSQFFAPTSAEPTPVAPPQEPGTFSELGKGIARGLLTTGEGLSRLASPILPGDSGAGLYNFFHAMQPEASEEQARWHAGLNQAIAPYQGEYSDQHPFASTLGQVGAAVRYGLANLGKGTGSYLAEQIGQLAIPAGSVGLGAKVAGTALPRVAALAAKSPALTTALGIGSVSGLTDIGASLGQDMQNRVAAGESPKAIFSGPNDDISAAARHATMVGLTDAATGGWMSKFGGRPMNAVLPWQRPLLRDAEAAITGATPNYTQALNLLDRAAQPATLRQRMGYGARDLGIGVAGQGVGEALGGIAQTGQYDPTQVALEIAGGIGPVSAQFAFANQHRAGLPQAYDDLRARVASRQNIESALAQRDANFQDFTLRDQQIQQALQLEQMQQAQADARVESNNAFARQYLQPQADPARLNLDYFNTMLVNPGIDPSTVYVPDAVKILDQYHLSPFEWPTIVANAKFNTPLATDNSILFSGLMAAREKVVDNADPIARKQVQEIDNQLVQLLPAPLRKGLPKVDGRYDAKVLLPRVAAEIHKQVVDAARDGTQNAVLSQNTANFENSLAEYLNHAQDNFVIQHNNAAELQRILNRSAIIEQAALQNNQVLQSDPATKYVDGVPALNLSPNEVMFRQALARAQLFPEQLAALADQQSMQPAETAQVAGSRVNHVTEPAASVIGQALARAQLFPEQLAALADQQSMQPAEPAVSAFVQALINARLTKEQLAALADQQSMKPAEPAASVIGQALARAQLSPEQLAALADQQSMKPAEPAASAFVQALTNARLTKEQLAELANQQSTQPAETARVAGSRVNHVTEPAASVLEQALARAKLSPEQLAKLADQQSMQPVQSATTGVTPSGLAARIKPTVKPTTQRLPKQSATTKVAQTVPSAATETSQAAPAATETSQAAPAATETSQAAPAATETSQAAPVAETSKKKDLVTEESVTPTQSNAPLVVAESPATPPTSFPYRDPGGSVVYDGETHFRDIERGGLKLLPSIRKDLFKGNQYIGPRYVIPATGGRHFFASDWAQAQKILDSEAKRREANRVKEQAVRTDARDNRARFLLRVFREDYAKGVPAVEILRTHHFNLTSTGKIRSGNQIGDAKMLESIGITDAKSLEAVLQSPSFVASSEEEVSDAQQVSATSETDAGRRAQPSVRQEGGDTAESSAGVRTGGQEKSSTNTSETHTEIVKRLDRAVESTANDSVAAQAQFTADVDENGPFAPGERVAFSESIPPALQSWATDFLNSLGIKTRMFLTTQEDLNRLDALDRYGLVGPFGYLLTRSQGPESSSRAIRLRNGDYALVLRWHPQDSIGFKLESAAHEVGHALEREVLTGASPEVRKAVYAAFLRSKHGAKYRTTKQHLAGVLSPSVFSEVVRNTPQETLSKSATDLREYWWADFSEWFANQTARWSVSDAKPLSIVDKFFKSLADALRKLYASITGKTFLPTEEFQRLLNERTANTTFDSTLSLGESRSNLESAPGMLTDAHELRRSLDEAVRDLPQEMTSSFSNVAHSAGQQVYRAITKALNFGQLVEELERITPASMHEVLVRLLDQRNAQRVAGHAHVEAVTQILRGVTSLQKEQQTALQKTMNHNTFYGLHAEQPWSTHTWHNQTDSTMLAHFNESQKLWGSLSPEAKTFYRQMRDLNIQLRQEYISAIEHSMSDLHGGATLETQKLIKEMTDSLKSRQGDYFHLGRFGDINVIAWDENGKTVHHSMYADGAKALEEFYALKKAQPSWRVVHTRQKDYIATLDRVPSTVYAKMRDLIDRQIDKRAQQITKRKTLGWNQKQSQIGNLNQLKESMRQSLAELYLHTLPPDMTSAQRQRRGIPGFSEEAVRVFAENAIQASRNIANVRYSPLIEKTFNDLEHQLFSHTRSGTDESTVAAMDLYNTMRQQYANIKKENTPRAVTAISQLGFAYMLGRPVKLLHNALQTWFVAAPRLMAEYGESASLGALSKYTRQYLMRAKDTGNPVIDRILHQLQETGYIDFTQYAEVMDFVNGKNYQTLYNRALTGLGWFMHKSEMYNRQVTAAATVDLALRKNPRLAERDAEGNLIHEKELMQIATKQLNDSHGDYSAEGRPVVMQGPIRKLLFMFRRYSMFMMYRLAADTRELINNTAQIKQLDKQIAATTDATLRGELVASRDAVVENRKQFVKTLGYTFGINGATMGLLGLPLAGQVAMLANALIGGLQSDDDEPYDVVRELKIYLNKQLPKTVTDTIVHGGTFSILGMDMSQSVGLGYLLPFLPDRLSPARSYDDSFNTTLIHALGPAASLVRNLFVGSLAGGNAALSFARNEPTSPKVMEELLRGLPAIVEDFHKALKMYATGEYRTVSGKTSLSRNEPRFTPGALDVAYRAIGQTPATATRAYNDFGHATAYKEQIKTRRSELFNMWFNAVQGTQHQRSQALAAINRFNEKNPQFKITAESLRASVEQKRLNYALSRRGNYTGDKDLTGTQFAPLVPRI